MKILLPQVFSHKDPLYLWPTYLRTFGYPSHRYRQVFRSTGKVKQALFEEGLYEGIEFDAHHTDIFFYKDWAVDWVRVKRFTRQGTPIEAVHAHYPMGIRLIKRSDILLNLAVRSSRVVAGLMSHIELTSKLIKEKRLLVVHPGVVKQEMAAAEAVENIISNLKACSSLLEEREVVLGLENLNPAFGPGWRSVGGDYKVLKEIIEKLNHPNIKAVYDFGHANAYARDYWEKNKETLFETYLTHFSYHKELIESLGKNIVYAHLNYNPAHDLQKIQLKNFFLSGWDYHLGLDKIPDKWRPGYKGLIKLLCEKTSIKEFGKILLEIRPHRLFRFLDFSSFGVTDKEAIETVKLLRNWLEEFK